MLKYIKFINIPNITGKLSDVSKNWSKVMYHYWIHESQKVQKAKTDSRDLSCRSSSVGLLLSTRVFVAVKGWDTFEGPTSKTYSSTCPFPVYYVWQLQGRERETEENWFFFFLFLKRKIIKKKTHKIERERERRERWW